jgi:hypothetical protein
VKIFVQIASYRDPELVFTVKHCLERAKNPENLVFAICWQHDENENIDELFQVVTPEQLKIIDINYKNSRGVCWARSQLNNLYDGEDFTLQIDSHTRFVQDWDAKILEMWCELRDPKGILTTYPPEYEPGQEENEWKKNPHIIHVYNIKDGHTEQRPKTPIDISTRQTPYRAIHVAAGFIFGPGKFIKDVPYDPEFYFSGEETALAVRLFTNGYNIYHPHQIIIYHYYGRKTQPKHWTDNADWGKYSILAKDRLNCLLGRNTKFDLGKYNLGSTRTLKEFMDYSGIDYARNILHLDTMAAKEPPVDLSDSSKWSYNTKQFKQILKWDYKDIEKCDDPRFWAFIIKDQNDHELFRQDIKFKDSPDIINGLITEKEFNFTYYSPAQIPTIFIIWPYSESKKWIKKYKTTFKLES